MDGDGYIAVSGTNTLILSMSVNELQTTFRLGLGLAKGRYAGPQVGMYVGSMTGRTRLNNASAGRVSPGASVFL